MRIRALVCCFAILMFTASVFAAAPAGVLHKGIVPIIGTTAGADTTQPAFHTNVTLYGKQGLRGRVVFHPAGQVANDDTDPFYRYLCGSRNCSIGGANFAGAGISGPFIGSMDIIPDADSDQTIPMAYTSIYYGPIGGPTPQMLVPFGTDVPRVISDEWAAQQLSGDASHRFTYVQWINPGGFRTTLGMRTLTDVTYSVSIVNLSGVSEKIVSGAKLPAGFTYFAPLQAVLGTRVLQQNEDVRVDIESGSAIGFYSYTSNVTNAPTFRLSEPLNDPVAFGALQ